MPDRAQLTVPLPVLSDPDLRRRSFGRTLTARAVLVTCAVALVSVLATAVVAVPLATRAAELQAREALAAQARLAAEVLRPRVDRGRAADE
ncbi:MAG TPA: two-component sensor histidine kinase, partial [Micromonosporaceae bacterium]